MKAVVFHKPGEMRVDKVEEPQIENPQDIILRVTATAICGSDLHIDNGVVPQQKPLIMGHEFMGVIEDCGGEVSTVQKGDRVVVPFPIACGRCFFCNHGLPGHCEHSTPKNYGGYSGGQAEYVRVPYANFGPRKVPDELSDEEVLFLTDILPTGYTAIDWAQLKGGETVAVFGCGPVGTDGAKGGLA